MHNVCLLILKYRTIYPDMVDQKWPQILRNFAHQGVGFVFFPFESGLHCVCTGHVMLCRFWT